MPGWLKQIAEEMDSWKRLAVALVFLVTTFLGGITMGVSYATSEIRTAVRVNSGRLDRSDRLGEATTSQLYNIMLSQMYLADAIDPASSPAEKRAALRKMRELSVGVPYVGKER